jgi:NAD-dependent deacetylase
MRQMPDSATGPTTAAALERAARLIAGSRRLAAFTGAGVSAESGIPPFRGPGGLWSRYDPATLELSYFRSHPLECWRILKEIFYDCFAGANPNQAHYVLARWERRELLKSLITQNIDSLHQRAGSERVIELHGSSRRLVCTTCGGTRPADPRLLERLPPRCSCGGVLKPDMVFFGEILPEGAFRQAEEAAQASDLMLVIGSTGEVFPAASIPDRAAQAGALIVEVNPTPSRFTYSVTDLFLPLAAGAALGRIDELLGGGLPGPASSAPPELWEP